MSKSKNIENPLTKAETISRKEAMKKAGKYAAFTAASMMLVLNPVKSSAQQQSIPPPR